MVNWAKQHDGWMASLVRSGLLRVQIVVIALVTFCLLSGPVWACAFDMVKPERTQIDWIVDSERLVLARPTEADPFAFAVSDVLVGADAGPPIPYLADSATRRRLAMNSGDMVLFAHRADTGWHRVVYVDDAFRPILGAALAHRQFWQGAMPQSRLDFIVALQDSPLRSHKAIVIGELDKVPYAQLRQLDLRIPSEELIGGLWDKNGYPFRAIRALLVGLSGTPNDRKEIHDYIHRATTWHQSDHLGAFAAAYIELEGVKGVEFLTKQILLGRNQSLDKLEQITMAMSVHHGLPNPRLKAAIEKAMQDMVSARADTGVIVARQFSLRSDWSQTAVLQPLVSERRVAMGDLLTISVYLARAREEAAQEVIYE